MKFSDYITEANDPRKNKNALALIKQHKKAFNPNDYDLQSEFADIADLAAMEDDTIPRQDMKDALMIWAEEAIDGALDTAEWK